MLYNVYYSCCTIYQEARTHAATSLNIDCVTKLTFAEARFTFKLKGIEFSPSSSSKNGWTITPDHTPAEVSAGHRPFLFVIWLHACIQ